MQITLLIISYLVYDFNMSITNNIKKSIKQFMIIYKPVFLTIQFINKHFISSELSIKYTFKHRLKRRLDLKNPELYNDKLQWLKLYWRDDLAILCADKYEVREYVKQTIGYEYLNELFGVYDSIDQINIDSLPNQFILKGTHGSGFNIICLDKGMFNQNKEFKKLDLWLRINYFYKGREWVYQTIQPRIIAEKYLCDTHGNPPMDYKIYCFNGIPRLIQVDIDRFNHHKQNFYDCEWNFRDVHIWCENDKELMIDKPLNFDKMLEISCVLSKPFPHVRVDLYNLEGKILFGELTFFHLNGYMPFIDSSLEKEMGDWLDLSSIDQRGKYHYVTEETH